MTTTDLSLIAFLDANDVIPNSSNVGVLQQDKIEQNTPSPYVCLQRSSVDAQLDCSGKPLLTVEVFNLEIYANDDDIVHTIANNIRTLLHGYIGTFGTNFAHSIFVSDQADDYEPRNAGNTIDPGLFYITLVVEITT